MNDFQYLKNLFNEYEYKIKQLTIENKRLTDENEQLKIKMKLLETKYNQKLTNLKKNSDLELQITSLSSKNYTTHKVVIERINLYRNIFYSREDVYAIRWEKNGQSGYSPKISAGNQNLPQANEKEYTSISDQVIFDHLAGNHTIGIYPIRLDQTVSFLVLDFDKEGWQRDANLFMQTCHTFKVPAYVERSRSGDGGHVWMFFAKPVLAKTARELGNALLKYIKDLNPANHIKSFDRMFPNQNQIAPGGLGNLIALPLQKQPLQKGNSAFINKDFVAYDDQWEFLKSIKKIDENEILNVLKQLKERDNQSNQYHLNLSKNKEPITLDKSDVPQSLIINYSNCITITKDQLSPKFKSLLHNMSSFSNPEFYKKEKLKMSTYNTPRMLSLYKEYGSTIQLPRGLFEQVSNIIQSNNIPCQINYNWTEGATINGNFRGQLKAKQDKVVDELLKKPTGILHATTGFGKTVIAAAMISKLKTSTLIIVNNHNLLEQWVQQLNKFLELDSNSIGQYSGLLKSRTGKIDVALIQSLNYKGNIPDFIKEYGLVLVDECHHASSYRYEQVLNQITAKYVYGLTATLIRKDGQHPIVKMLLGDVRYTVGAIEEQQFKNTKRLVKKINIDLIDFPLDTNIHTIYQSLLESSKRNEKIINDILSVLDQGKVPLVITERRQHLEIISTLLEKDVKNVFVLCGGIGKKKLKETLNKMESRLDEKGKSVVLATGKYIGEGFDEPRLDTMFLTMPMSWKGIIQQYIGRLEREYDGKSEILVYDYVDQHPVLKKMFNKRKKGYKEIGYEIIEDEITYDNLFSLNQ